MHDRLSSLKQRAMDRRETLDLLNAYLYVYPQLRLGQAVCIVAGAVTGTNTMDPFYVTDADLAATIRKLLDG